MTLFDLVKELLIEQGDSTPHKVARYIQYGISGLREFSMDFSGQTIKIAVLPVNSNGTVDLPSDYIKYRRVATCSEDGNLHDLGWNPDMCSLAPDDCGNLLPNGGNNNDTIFGYADNDFRNGEILGRQFGLGGGNNTIGYYKFDEANGMIILQNYKGGTLWMEYVADLQRNSNGEHEVHPFLYESLKAFIQWKNMQRNTTSTFSANDKQLAYVDFKREKTIAIRRFQSFTISEAMAIGRKTFTQTPKY